MLRDWQYDAAPMQLHPGDLGWYWRFGAEATSAAVRTWRRDGQIRAVGLLDGAELLRLTTAPDAQRDEELARQLVEDVTLPERGVLPAGRVAVEAPMGALVMDLLSADGYGMAMTLAAARALQELGSSSAVVCTPSSNVGAVATYKSAGFQELPERRDRYRDA